MSRLQQQKKIESYLNTIRKRDKREGLWNAWLEEIDGVTYQVVSDSYTAVLFDDPFELSKIETDKQHPIIEKLLSFMKSIEPKGTIKVDYTEIAKLAKLYRAKDEKTWYNTFKNDSISITLNVKFLKNVFDMLGLKKEHCIEVYFDSIGSSRIAIIKDDKTKSFGVIVGVIKYD